MITGINGYGASQYAYTAKNTAVDEQAEKTTAVKSSDDKVQKADARQEEKTVGASVQKIETATAKTDDVKASQDSGDKAGKAPVKTDVKGVMDSFRGGKELNIFSSTSRFNEIEDAEKAVKDMKKDDVLDRYTYFVNPTTTGLGTDADGTVRLKGTN